ncbi:hypothetical protein METBISCDRAFT_24269 [Metschnikowia bicuspidata]|uniref:Uncharacterized protein n=1 Tax=Metschnikowia bicuspidata TaxID=27322 RepID=A0A4P9Z9E2_9ASCO|nr:hypothetical protein METBISCDRAFT_24269 [Metschnikowia bicuspidata]
MNIRNVEQPIKRKRGRPPKKQPLDVYTSFTSLFQTVSGSIIPDAESNSNVMVKLGKPDSCIPLMKVSQSSGTKHRHRGRGALASGGAKSLTTVLPSRSGSPSGSQLSLGTPLSTNANVPFQGSFRAPPDNQVENIQGVIGSQDDGFDTIMPRMRRILSSYDVPPASVQYASCSYISSACRSDSEVCFEALGQSPVNHDLGILYELTKEIIGQNYLGTESVKSPSSHLSAAQNDNHISFNSFVCDRSRAALSFEQGIFDLNDLAPLERLEHHKLEIVVNNDVYIYSSIMDRSSVSDKDMLPRVPNCRTECASEYGTSMLNNINEIAVKFDLHPQMNSTMDINSSPEIKWPSATDMIPGTDANSDWNCFKEIPSCMHMAINLNALPCSDLCDARAALKRAFSEHCLLRL